MTWDERVAKVRLHGFTDRQSAFLVTVMLHAGVCLGRHYCTFAGLAYGRKMHDFFQALLARGYATAHACGHHKARLYHIHYKPLYRAIGEPNNRHRRPTALPRAIERLMLLDAVLADRERTWLATEQDKLAYFTLTHRVPRRDLPSLTFRAADAETVRDNFRRNCRLGSTQTAGPTSFCCSDAGCAGRFSRLSRAARRSASGAAGVDRAPARAVPQGRCHPDLSSRLSRAGRLPLRPAVLEDLRWFFHARRTPPHGPHERFDQAVRAFGAPRFQALYRAWLEGGEPVLDATFRRR